MTLIASQAQTIDMVYGSEFGLTRTQGVSDDEKAIADIAPIYYWLSRVERVGNSVRAHARKVSANMKASHGGDP